MPVALRCGLAVLAAMACAHEARSQTHLDTLGAPPALGQTVAPQPPPRRAAQPSRPRPAEPVAIPAAPAAPPVDFSGGAPPIVSDGQPVPVTPGLEPRGEPCSPGTPCLRIMPQGLPAPVLGSGSPLLDVGVGQNFTASAARNAQAVERMAADLQAAEEARERRARESVSPPASRPEGETPPAPAESVGSGQPPAGVPAPARAVPDRRASLAGPCSSTSDINQLLSPSCLETLRSLRPGGAPFGGAGGVLGSLLAPGGSGGMSGIPVPAPAAPVQQVNCAVAMFTQGAGGAMTPVPGGVVSFQVPDAPRCIEAAVRLSFGIPGLTNISLTPPGGATIGVMCYRPPTAPTTVSCAPQPAAGR